MFEPEFFFLSPVQVVKVDRDNLEEVAAWCGGSVLETESNRVPGRMDKYVYVPTTRDSRASWAFPGMFVTRRLVILADGNTRSTWAVFRRDYFEKNYFSNPTMAVDQTWEKNARKEQAEARKKPAAPKNSQAKKWRPKEEMFEASFEEIAEAAGTDVDTVAAVIDAREDGVASFIVMNEPPRSESQRAIEKVVADAEAIGVTVNNPFSHG